ncbi:MAG: domain S-box protein [Gemmataceae bacterium]|nr:domain S-box protein [Gemmataceae bacterium]
MNNAHGSEEQLRATRPDQPGADRSRVEEVARDALPQHRGLSIDRLPLAYVRFDADHRVLDWNPAAEAMFGYTRDEIVGEVLPDRILPRPVDDRVSDILRRLHAGDMQAHSVNENRTKDGRVITCEWFNTPLADPDGRFAGAVSLARDVTDERRTAEQLAESQRRFRAVFENSLEAILLMDDAGRYVDANPAACQLLGYTRDEIVGLHVSDVTRGVDRGRIPELMRRFLAAGTLNGEYTLVCKGGATREVEYRSVANILPGLHLGVHRDIADRRQAERTLRENHGLLTAVVEGIPQALFVKDRGGRYRLLNSPGARLVGKEVEDVIGRDDTALFDAETARRFAEADRRVMETGAAMTYEETGTTAGVTRTYLTTKAPFRGPDGEIGGVIGVARDVTERRAAEEELRRQKEILQTIFDHIPVMINFVDPSGRVRLVNGEWERVMGWTLSDAQARDMSAEFYPDPDERRRVLEFIRNPPPGWADFRTRTRDGRVIDTSWANLLLSDGTSIGIGQDVTDRKRAEAERERLHREVAAGRAELEVLSRRLIEAQEAERAHLARELHDEIGQVLTTVNLTLEAVRARSGPAVADRLDESRRVVDRAIEQVRSLSLDLRPASLDLLGLEPALRAYLARRAAHAGLALAFTGSLGGERLPPALETVCFRVVQEAATNVLRHARATRLGVDLSRTDEEVRVTIRDDGAGFDVAAAWERVLRGEGFGLAGMRERAQLFGGRIGVESAVGSGTTIVVHFPVAGGAESRPQ